MRLFGVQTQTLALALALTFAGCCLTWSSPVSAQLSAAETTTLTFMREEEKLARDAYLTFYSRYGTMVFANVARSEQRHMDAVRVVMDRYSVPDPISSDAVGVFTNPVLADLYVDLTAQGETSLLEALKAAALIEEIDIRDLRLAIAETNRADVALMYQNLEAGSHNHLNGFVTQIQFLGVSYQAQLLSQSDVDDILDRPTMTAERSDGGWIVVGHSHEGITIDVTTNGQVVVYWMTYDNQGNQVWLFGMSDEIVESEINLAMSRYSGPQFGPDFNPADVVGEQWGTLKIRFIDCTHAEASYESLFGNADIALERIYFSNGANCQN